MQTAPDQCIEILQLTRDGDDLSPDHLGLVQAAINGRLSDKGVAAFAELLESARDGYVKPWLHHQPHLTIDHHGFVYWKGQEIERWSGDLAFSDEGMRQAQTLARRCMVLEHEGVKISSASVIWRWNDRAPKPAGEESANGQ